MRTGDKLLLLCTCLTILAIPSSAAAELCEKCKDKVYIQTVGKCAECGGTTSSGAFKLCKPCSAKLGQCEHCRAKLGNAKGENDLAAERPPVVPRPDTRAQYVAATRRGVESLMASLDTFTFRLEYHGPDPDKHPSLFLAVSPLAEKLPASCLAVRISKEQAAAVIGHLATDGFLYRGTINSMKLLVQPKEPYYSLHVQSGKANGGFEFIPWESRPYRWHHMTRPPMVQQMDNLQAVLVGDAAKAMDKLVETIDPLGRQRVAEEKIADLVAKNEVVVFGTVTGVRVDARPGMHLNFDVRVEKWVKGKHEGDTLRFYSLGGTDYAKYAKGDKVLLFLSYSPGTRRDLMIGHPPIYLSKPDNPAAGPEGYWEVRHCLKVLAGSGEPGRPRGAPTTRPTTVRPSSPQAQPATSQAATTGPRNDLTLEMFLPYLNKQHSLNDVTWAFPHPHFYNAGGLFAWATYKLSDGTSLTVGQHGTASATLRNAKGETIRTFPFGTWNETSARRTTQPSSVQAAQPASRPAM